LDGNIISPLSLKFYEEEIENNFASFNAKIDNDQSLSSGDLSAFSGSSV